MHIVTIVYSTSPYQSTSPLQIHTVYHVNFANAAGRPKNIVQKEG